jgi:hypothetical protein
MILLENMSNRHVFGAPNPTLVPPKRERWANVELARHAQQLPFTGPEYEVRKTALTNLTISFTGEA